MAGDTDIADSQPTNDEATSCTTSACVADDDTYKFKCIECHRLVHYRCTRLPAYQVYLFTITGYRKFKCANCVDVPKYLQVMTPDMPASHSKTMTDLTNALEECNAENDTHNINNLALTNKQKELRAELEKVNTLCRKYEEDLSELQSDVDKHEKSLKRYEDKEVQLQSIIANKQQELVDQQNKFEEAGNPEYDAIMKLEELVDTKLEAVGKNLKDFLSKEVSENNKKINEKLDQVMKENRSYAESVKNIAPQSGEILHKPIASLNLRTIIKETRNEELVEESEKKQRACNIIIHGVEENAATDKEEAKESDQEFIANFIRAVGLNKIKYKNCVRIGKSDPSKKRPIKVVLNSEAEKNNIMENLKELKGQESFRGISVTDDYTITERQMIKNQSEKAKEQNNKEPPNSRYVWRVRGTPKNGLHLKKFLKKAPVAIHS